MSFFGGGTDYPGWFEEHGGCVLATTINKYTYISARWMPPFLGSRYRVVWSKFECVDERDSIVHPGVRGCLQYLDIDECFEVNHAGDLPARSGLGSSSAFTVGMLHALHGLKHRHASKDQLAREAIEVEQRVLKETVGIQDQIECAHGGINFIEIDRSGEYCVRPVIMSPQRLQELQSHCMLFFTGLVRHASQIADDQIKGMADHTLQLKAIQEMAKDGLIILTGSGPIESFGELLHDAWLAKRGLSSSITNAEIDQWYAAALEAGALGGKILGAGGGGFLLVFARPGDQPFVRAALRRLIEVPVVFERCGTQIVHSS